MLNKVMLIGRLGRDPDLRYSQGGAPVVNFSVATDESYTDKDGNRQNRTEWHRIVAFQRLAETCSTYLSKGSLVYVEGSLTTRKWQDQQGQDRYTTEIRAQTVRFLDKKGERQGQDADDGYGAQGYQRQQRQSGGASGWDQQPRQDGRPGQAPSYPKNPPQAAHAMPDEDLGPAFPSEAANMGGGSAMDEVPF